MLKMKKILKESNVWERKFGESLPTLDSIQKKHKKMNEGPAYEYGDQISKIDKLYDVYWDAVKDFGRLLEKKGFRKESKELYMKYRKNVSAFSQWFGKFADKFL